MLNKKLAAAAPVLFLALSSNAFAWKSISILGSSTHTKIAAKALDQVDFSQYPDMKTSAKFIKNGSSSEAGHENIHNGGGKLKDWWTGGDARETLLGGVLPNYTRLKITDAYMNIGRMCHLTQDQAVPAHAAHIPHSVVLNLPPDGVEKYVGANPDFGAIPAITGDKMPYEYYQELQNDTKRHLSGWINPATGIPFWTQSPEASRYPDATLGPVGLYGGGADTFGAATAESKLSPNGLTAVQIAARQLGMAAGYTKGLVESASKRLPPLVSGMALYPSVVLPGKQIEVAFTALENRTRHVKYEVYAAPEGGVRQVVLAGEVNLEEPVAVFNANNGDSATPLPKPEESLFNRRVNLKWTPALNGLPLAQGSYVIEVQLMDDDGNTIPASVNADDVGDNNTVRSLSVVNIEPVNPALVNFH